MIIAFKYNIECREKPNTGKTWMVYKDAEKGLKDPIYTDHIEIKADLWTNQKTHGLGFAMCVEGVVKKKVNPANGKPYILIDKE